MARLVLLLILTVFYFTSVDASDGSVADYFPGVSWGGFCDSGNAQSPVTINRNSVKPLPPNVPRAVFDNFGVAKGYTVFTTGTSIEVVFDKFIVQPEILVPSDEYISISDEDDVADGLVKVDLLQFHFHTASEHTIDGQYAPGELHLVTKVSEGQSAHCDESEDGCLVVFGVMLQYDGDDGDKSTYIMRKVFHPNPAEIGEEHGVHNGGNLNLNALFPKDEGYFFYLGSLTTPPCTEIVSWYVFHTPMPISVAQVTKHQRVVSYTPGPDCLFTYGHTCTPPREKTNNRQIHKLNGRTVYTTGE